MLVLTRKLNESIQIGDNVTITVLRIGDTVRIGISAPKDVTILREELIKGEKNENENDCGGGQGSPNRTSDAE